MGCIVIDVGTTNTRIRYVEQRHILGEYKSKIGVRDTAIIGSLSDLKECLRVGISTCLEGCNKTPGDVEKIIAYGMVTSNLGLVEIPHLQVPVSLRDLSYNIEIKCFEEIFHKPIYFIPGIKNKVNDISLENFHEMDIMRGEEVEAFGVIKIYPSNNKKIFISPGSHTKFVFINDRKEITKCSTTLTGELLWALSKETILADSIPETLITHAEEAYIQRGMDMAKQYGFSKACFLLRIIDGFTEATGNQRANFIMGVIGYYDILSIMDELEKTEPEILIGGSNILRKIYGEILKLQGYPLTKVILLEDDEVKKSSVLGAIDIIEKR